MLPHISTHHLPDLHDVVLGDGADDPRFIRVPGKVRYLCCVSAVNELQKGHPIQIHDMLVAKAYIPVLKLQAQINGQQSKRE